MTKRSNVVAIVAILACSLLAGISAASAQTTNFSPSNIMRVESRACTCQDDCRDSIDCSDFCANACTGRCAARYRAALNACLRRCGRCRFPQ